MVVVELEPLVTRYSGTGRREETGGRQNRRNRSKKEARSIKIGPTKPTPCQLGVFWMEGTCSIVRGWSGDVYELSGLRGVR